MIFCQATNEAATRRQDPSLGHTPVPCRNAASYLLLHRDGTIISACCGKHRWWITRAWHPSGTCLIQSRMLFKLAREAFYGLFR